MTSERNRVERYDPAAIEPRWQARWAELGLHRTDLDDATRPTYYLLTMYDYPSGDLHVGHWYVKTPTDALARYRRMQGDNVFFPVGFDAFGLPAENAAIKNRIHPAQWTYREHRQHAPPAAEHGRVVRLGRRGRHLRPDVLPLEPVALPALPGGRPGLPRDGAGRLVPQRRDARPRAGRGRRPALLALRRAGREARPGPVVPADHEVRRRAPRLQRHRLAGAGPDHADELDRPVSEGAEVVFRSAPDAHHRRRRRDPRLHHAARHAVRGDLHGPRARSTRSSSG